MLTSVDLITGATGFIGQHLTRCLISDGRPIRALVRQPQNMTSAYCVADLADFPDLVTACAGVERIFHCAGYAHTFSSPTTSGSSRHWRVNFEGTYNLIKAASEVGVKRFVFLSTVKAMAEPGDLCADENFPGHPTTVYGQSKRAAEEAVLEAGQRYGMHVVNLRLALVYGSGGRGNLERMARLVRRGGFPPLPETGNHRSLIHVDDVVDAMVLVAGDDRANGKTYIVANPEAPSGRELYDTMREVLGRRRLFWSVPETILRGGARCGDMFELLFKRRIPLDSMAIERLLGSAWYSSARLTHELGWKAKVSLREGLREMFGC